ncbi:MAG TPA: hypothetical protein VFK80_04995, partial [Limnochordia bacterium]|nr:hypothetical protein [Limnochordia bacterium]
VHDAKEHLDYIRRTMAAAGQFTDVPGRALVFIGAIGLAAAAANLRFWPGAGHPLEPWLWVLALALAAVIGCVGVVRKARRRGSPLQKLFIRKLLWGFGPALAAGALLSAVVWRRGELDLLPVLWLASYGAAVISGGQVSVAPVRWLGLSEIGVAVLAALTPPGYGLAWMALGFGLLHLLFGQFIARRYDG